MPIAINGSGTITGISAGGLPDGVITTDDIAANAVTYAKIGTTEQGQLCKAWVNFNGTSTVAIRASYNVSSITDNGTGDYTVNFTTALADTNYVGVALSNDNSGGTNLVIASENQSRTKSTSAFNIWTAYGGNGVNKTLYDVNTINVAIFR